MFDMNFWQWFFYGISCIAFFLMGIFFAVDHYSEAVEKLKTQIKALTERNEIDRESYRKNLFNAVDTNRKLKNENLVLAEQLNQEKEMYENLQTAIDR